VINNYNSNNHVMVDVETLGSNSTSVMASISLVRFNPYTGQVFENLNLNIDISLGLHLGAEVSSDTIMWWMGQSETARMSLIDSQVDPMDPIDVTILINDWIVGIEKEIDMDLILWGNGAGFDIPILTNYYHLLGMDLPWKFYNVRDVRTVVDFCPEIKSSTVFEGTQHVPYFDCLHQIKYVSNTLQYVYKPHLTD
jgi:hypothetical protein